MDRDVRAAALAAGALERDRFGVAVMSLERRLAWDPTLAPEQTKPQRRRLLHDAIEATAGLASAQASLILDLVDHGELPDAQALRASAALGELQEEVDLRFAMETESVPEARVLASRLLAQRPHSCEAANDWL